MAKFYKLTKSNDRTIKDTQWGENVEHKVSGELKMCHSGIHAYYSPAFAAVFNPIHARFVQPHLWECELSEDRIEDSDKVCARWCRTIREVPFPNITVNQRVILAIRCALLAYDNELFSAWANAWLDGSNRTPRSGMAANSRAARSAVYAAENAGDVEKIRDARGPSLLYTWQIHNYAESFRHSANSHAAEAILAAIRDDPDPDRVIALIEEGVKEFTA